MTAMIQKGEEVLRVRKLFRKTRFGFFGTLPRSSH